ncbi:hypothetical protein PG993_009494 [Apiospora rasikravindrae]|uniref:Uncharacterized protein n=1 Tax=Apiospora rasikravindrae TaxID=990691 RepID=A0ABR1SJL5_9PEZI
MILVLVLLGLLSMVSAAVDRLLVQPDSLADYEYSVKVENNTVSAVLANGTVIHDNRDPCTNRYDYEIGKEYLEADCPARIKFMNSNGFCDVNQGFGTTHPCIAFCQVRTTYHYDKELVWDRTWCRGPVDCETTRGTTYSMPYHIDFPSVEDFYKDGISGEYHASDTDVFSPSPPQNIHLGTEECGYWAYITFKKTICGSTSWAIVDQAPGSQKCLYNKIWESITVGNDCLDVNPVGYSSGAAGKTVFVRVDCWELKPLPPDQQEDGAYIQAARKMSPDDLDKKLTSWTDFSCDLWGADGVSWYAVWLQGRGFAGKVIGKTGGQLESDIKNRCNMPGGWQFGWTQGGAPDYWEWWANVPIKTNNGQGAGWQCVLDHLYGIGGPRKSYAKDCHWKP